MGKLARATQLLFGSTAGTNQMAEFGSFAAATPARYTGATITPAIIQALSNYLEGWFAAVDGENSPTIEDMNSLCYLFSYQLAYIMQAGVPEWDSGTTYYIGSLVNVSGVLYTSLQNNNLNNATSNGAFWKPGVPGSAWTTVTGNTTLAVNTSYQVNDASLCLLTLPATAAVGDVIEVQGISSNGFTIQSNSALNNNLWDNSVTRASLSGNNTPLWGSTASHSSVKLVCIGVNTDWAVFSKNGGQPTQNYFGTGADGDTVISANTSLVPSVINSAYDAEAIVKNYGNLTINSGSTLTTSQPCRLLLIYATGNVVINGTLSMSLRGDFVNPSTVGVSSSGLTFRRIKTGSSATSLGTNLLAGSGTAAVAAENNQPIVNGSGFVVSIPQVGGAGGGPASGTPGGAVTDGTGGGGAGASNNGAGGIGAAGTCFSGGASGGGGGTSAGSNGGAGGAFGGAGGNGGNGTQGGSGAGNPGGTGADVIATGLGGVVVIIAKGSVTVGSTGSITANGHAGGDSSFGGGGGGGGGVILIMSGGAFSNLGSISAAGGAGGPNGVAGAGGNGSVIQQIVDAV